MILSLEELKAMVIFCKEQKVKNLKIGNYHIEISDIGLIDGLGEVAQQKEETSSNKIMAESDPESNPSIYEDPDLYLSAT